MHILLLDNYDSFTYNLLHYVCELGANVAVHRNDEITVEAIMQGKPDGIIISPGPGTPDESGITLELVRQAVGHIPLLGVCLGHQAIGQVFGGKIVRADKPMHGKVSAISHNGQGIFAGLVSPYNVTRYHSLIIERASLPSCLNVTAETDDGVIMGIQHTEHALYGVQFHPESIACEYGHQLLQNFLNIIR